MDGLHENDDFNNGPSPEMLAFYRDHCGTSKKHVILVTAIFPPCDCGSDDCNDSEESQISNAFSSFESAQDWIDGLDHDAAVIFAPIVIDDPLYGNDAVN